MRKKTTQLSTFLLAVLSLVGMRVLAQPCVTPSNVTATPSTLCGTGTSQLNATSVGNNINWFTVPVGGVSLGTSASGANFPVTVSGTTTYYAEAVGISVTSATFNYTGAAQTFTVPVGVTSVTFDIQGAQGGIGYNLPNVTPGMGGRLQGTITTTPGEVLQINVGGVGGAGGTTIGGTPGWNGGGAGGGWSGGRSGGGGGGASDIRRAGTTLADRILVAAGGGGTGVNHSTGDAGGNGGGLTGANGLTGTYLGGGATQSAGGASNGALGVGGPGGSVNTGGGGGGGYYGGGGSLWEGGGGGSSYATPAGTSGIVHTAGFRSGSGIVTLTWNGSGACTASNRTPVTVSIAPLGAATNVTATPTMICQGDTAQLTGISTGSSISWYTLPSGGVAVGTSLSGANFPVAPSATMTYYAESMTPGPGSQTFNYTGAAQSFTVPPNVTSITFDVQGAQGGIGYNVPLVTPGMGGRVQGTITTTPGEVLQINVGGVGGAGGTTIGGTAGWNGGGVGGGWSGGRSGGGGGGASDIRRAGTALTDRIIVGSGGGGTGVNYSTGNAGGNGGGLTGANGLTGTYLGGGATQSAGGTPNGALGIGGGAPAGQTGGGGGGGYYGGGGSAWEGGGGGSSYCTTVGVTGLVHTAGFRTGDGIVTLTWSGTGCTAAVRIPVTVTLDNIAPTAICMPDTITLDSLGNATLPASEIDGGSTDNCAVDSLTLSQSAFTCADAGINTVTLTVTDANGNSSTCTATLTVFGLGISGAVVADTTTCGYNVSCETAQDGVATASGSGGCGVYSYLWSNGATTATATGLALGTYTVTITDVGGGTHVETVTLTAPSAIQLTATSSNSCVGDSTGAIDLSATGGNDCGGYTFLWSTGDVTEDVSGLSVGVYTVTVTDGNGCTGVQTFSVANSIPPSPTFTQTGNTLTSDLPWSSYQWMFNGNPIPGANSISFVWSVSGTYSLMVTDSNGCTGVSTNTVVVGIAQRMGDWAELSIYPNPTRDEFRLRTAVPIGYGVTVNVNDMFGRRILTKVLPDLNYEVAFDLRGFAVGTYIVEVHSEIGQHKLLRLVVE